jgi:hypothetical protein
MIENPDFLYDPDISPDAITVIFQWNPSGYHWVLFGASRTENEKRTIYIFDTSSHKHPSTWKYQKVLLIFMSLVGCFHPAFHGDWPEPT